MLATTNTCISTSDQQGNFGWWVNTGSYWFTITINGQVRGPYPISVPGGTTTVTGTPLNVQSFGCVPDTPGTQHASLGTDNTACLTAAFNAASISRTTLYFPANRVNRGYGYGISKAIQIGNLTTATFISTDGQAQNMAANSGSGQWGSVIIQTNAGQDILDVTYPTVNLSNSIAIRNLNFQWSDPGNVGNYVAPYGQVTVSGNIVTLVNAIFRNFNTNWFQPGGRASIYIQDSIRMGCPGNVCLITGVSDSTHLTISQTCTSFCPTNAAYSVGVGVHIIQPSLQTVGLIMDSVQIAQGGVGYLSDGGDQSPLWQNGTWFLNYIGQIGNGEVAVPQWKNWTFQANVRTGLLVPYGKIVLNSGMDSTVIEANGGSPSGAQDAQIEIDATAVIVGGTWNNVWFEFPVADEFHIYGSLHDWSCVGCIFNYSSEPSANQFVAIGASGAGQGTCYNITLTGGYAPNINGGAFTIAESLSYARQDPTTSNDPGFGHFNLDGFDLASSPLFGFYTATTGTSISFISDQNFKAGLFQPSSINGTVPNFVEVGKDPTGVSSLVINAPISVPSGQLSIGHQMVLGPNGTPTNASTLVLNNNLHSSGTVNTVAGGAVTVASYDVGSLLVSASWANQPITINSVSYSIKSVTNNNNFTVTPDPGNQTGVTFTLTGFTRFWIQAGQGQGSTPTYAVGQLWI